jgi:CBS domain-containing protein
MRASNTDPSRTALPVDGASALAAVMRQPVYCAPETPVRAALQIMHDRHIGSMIVTAAEMKPIGILTLRDVLDRIVLRDGILDRPISSVMSDELHMLPPHATVYEAVLVMLAHGIRHVLVVDKTRLAGPRKIFLRCSRSACVIWQPPSAVRRTSAG